MSLYQFLSKKLQRFTPVEFVMVKWIYVVLGVLVASLYTPLFMVSGWAYLIITLIASIPLMVSVSQFKGNIHKKIKQYLQNNNPSNQVLTLLSCAFFGIAAAVFFPILASLEWWVYVVIIAVLIIKPFTHVFLIKTTEY